MKLFLQFIIKHVVSSKDTIRSKATSLIEKLKSCKNDQVLEINIRKFVHT